MKNPVVIGSYLLKYQVRLRLRNLDLGGGEGVGMCVGRYAGMCG